ncbi:hypothetical protein DSLASN_41400 [Desulfoluna limicola]|uniref:Cyclic nucleotide-binding domain-containing protein n=1 Tax=Desulfoluna limicola TaxID=2810562 RepID=A0ABM7PMT4_9BACT|nr:Crp/Fnr family transcriptional regulator [Desulfoluna limicola]BCS98508.1 hypothetical protein DSLASN_41400 [Desulfoluna limicola]
MISRDDLRQAVIFEDLPDHLLDLVITVSKPKAFEEGEQVFKEGEPAGMFYMVRNGAVLIEQDISETTTVAVANLTPGECFGYSSITEEHTFSSSAICTEASEIIAFDTKALFDLMEKNHTLGYIIHSRMNKIIAQRLIRRTEQFLRALSTHPEIHELQE